MFKSPVADEPHEREEDDLLAHPEVPDRVPLVAEVHRGEVVVLDELPDRQFDLVGGGVPSYADGVEVILDQAVPPLHLAGGLGVPDRGEYVPDPEVEAHARELARAARGRDELAPVVRQDLFGDAVPRETGPHEGDRVARVGHGHEPVADYEPGVVVHDLEEPQVVPYECVVELPEGVRVLPLEVPEPGPPACPEDHALLAQDLVDGAGGDPELECDLLAADARRLPDGDDGLPPVVV